MRVLSSGPAGARVLLLIDDAEKAAALGADTVEPGLFEMTVSPADLADRHGVTSELVPSPGPRP